MAQIKNGLNRARVWTFEEACEFEASAQALCAADAIVRRRRPSERIAREPSASADGERQ
jgi:hypothetical protein